MRSSKETRQQAPRGPINWWKWVTIVLAGLIIGGGGMTVYQVTRPVVTTSAPVTTDSAGDVMHLSLTKDELNRLIKRYLKDYLKNETVKYSLKVGDHVVVKGTFKFFGSTIGFGLECDPYVQTNGNIMLKATKLNVGALSVPISYVMSYVGQNFKLPKMVNLDSKAKTIVLRLNQFDLGNGMRVQADRIDLANDEINLTGYIAK